MPPDTYCLVLCRLGTTLLLLQVGEGLHELRWSLNRGRPVS